MQGEKEQGKIRRDPWLPESVDDFREGLPDYATTRLSDYATTRLSDYATTRLSDYATTVPLPADDGTGRGVDGESGGVIGAGVEVAE